MEKRYEEIDLFLKEMAKIYKQNPENFDDRTVYEALKEFGLSERDKEDCTYEEIDMYRSIGIAPVSYYVPKEDEVKPKEWFSEMGFFTYFAKWASETGENLRSRISSNSYFFTFENTKFNSYIQNHSGKNPIKLYIPVGKDTFVKALPVLFKYLNDEDIMHNSKISAGVRADDVVIRVYNLTDAENLIQYVNENLKDQILTTNPFLIREGVVGIASDGTHSYNADISNHIASYIKQVVESEVGIDTFRTYINNNIHNNHGQTREIMQILAMSLDSDKTVQDYYEFWDRMTDIPHLKSKKRTSRRSRNTYDEAMINAYVDKTEIELDEKIESEKYAKGLDCRRQSEIEEKSKYSEDYKREMDSMREKMAVIAKVNEELKETFRKMDEEDRQFKQKMNDFYSSMYGLAILFGISRLDEYKEILNTDFGRIDSFMENTIELFKQKSIEHEEERRRMEEQRRKELEERIKAEKEAERKRREELEKLKQDPILWKKYQDEQAEKRRKEKEEKAAVVSYLRQLNEDFEENSEGNEIMNNNVKRVLKVIDDGTK